MVGIVSGGRVVGWAASCAVFSETFGDDARVYLVISVAFCVASMGGLPDLSSGPDKEIVGVIFSIWQCCRLLL